MTTSIPSSSGVQSLERAFRLLGLMAEHHNSGTTIRQLTQITGLSRPTIHRMVSFLLELHYLEQDSNTGVYRLGTAAMLLGLRAMSRPPLVQRYLPAMKRLARRTGEGVFMVVAIGDYCYNLHLEQAEPRNPTLANLVGTTRLMGLGIGSLSLLSMLSHTEIRQHYARHAAEYGAHGLSAARMLTGVERSLRLGYTLAAGHGISGVGYAFPVPSGHAAISVVSPIVRMPLTRRHQIAALLIQEVNAQTANPAAI